MPTPKEQRQRSHLQFIELLKEYRLKEELGRTGLTHVPVAKINGLTNFDLNMSVDILINDRLIVGCTARKKYKREAFQGERCYVFNVLKTAEEISEYEMGLEKNGLIVHIYKTGLRYEIYLNGYIEKKQFLSLAEVGLLLFLIMHEGEPLERDAIVGGAHYPNGRRFSDYGNYKDANRISSFSSSIRKKLKRIGIPKSEIGEIYPPYYSGGGCVFNKNKRVIFSVKDNFYLDQCSYPQFDTPLKNFIFCYIKNSNILELFLLQQALFSLVFEKFPDYNEIANGTPKLTWVFYLSSDMITTESLRVLSRGIEPLSDPPQGSVLSIERREDSTFLSFSSNEIFCEQKCFSLLVPFW